MSERGPVGFSADRKFLVCDCGETKPTTWGVALDALDAIAILTAWTERHAACRKLEARP